MLTIFHFTTFESRQVTIDYNMYLLMSNVHLLYQEENSSPPPPHLSWAKELHSFTPLNIFIEIYIETGLATCVLFACHVHIVLKYESNSLQRTSNALHDKSE